MSTFMNMDELVTTIFYFYGEEIGRTQGELNTLNRILFAIDWRWSFKEIRQPKFSIEQQHAFDKCDPRPHQLTPNCWCKPYQDDECNGLWVHRHSSHLESGNVH